MTGVRASIQQWVRQRAEKKISPHPANPLPFVAHVQDGKEGGDRKAGGKDQAPPPANLRYTVADLQEAADRILGSNS